MTILFKKSRTTISKHIKNILQSDIIIENSVSANFAQVHQKFAHVQYEGDHKVTREIDYYNLEIIMEVGNRMNSEITSIFYNWCMDTLADLNGENEIQSNLVRYENGNV
ncbi:MAG: virulence RhuM family protein [Bacilli bacterium]|nr:virulence RhuM family protein [Bacilli bacterium]